MRGIHCRLHVTLVLGSFIVGSLAFGQGQMTTVESGGPFHFDPPYALAFTEEGGTLPNGFAVVPVAADAQLESVYAVDNAGMWKIENSPDSDLGALVFPEQRIVSHPGQTDPFGWDALPRQQALAGRLNADEHLDVVTLDQTVVAGVVTSRIEILWGKSSPNVPGGNNIVNHFDLGFAANDLAVQWSDGTAGGILCLVGSGQIAVLRAPATGTVIPSESGQPSDGNQPLEPLNAPVMTVFPTVVTAVDAGGVASFAVAGTPPAPDPLPPQGQPIHTVDIEVFAPESPGDIHSAEFGETSTGRASQILAADLDGDGDDEIVLATKRSPETNTFDGRLYFFELSNGGAALEIVEVQRQSLFDIPTAMTIGDLGSTPEQRDGLPEIIVAGHASPKDPCWVKVFQNLGNFDNRWPEQEIVLGVLQSELFSEFHQAHSELRELFDPAVSIVTDLHVALLNNDEIPDIIGICPGRQTESSRGQFMLLRGQPPPIAAFITVATHGHRGINSVLHQSLWGETAEPSLDEFNAALGEIVFEMNRVRRNQEPQLPPVLHIGISGQWGDLTEHGASLHVVGRVFWLGSSYVVWAPTCLPPIPPGPATNPVAYWSSAIFLAVPAYSPPCVIGGPDAGTLTRFVGGALGAGAESLGRMCSAGASRRAAMELAAQIDGAVNRSRGQMDPCRGQIYLDLSGHSRGTTVSMQALRTITRPPLLFNTTVSLTDIDGIDPAPQDNLRPWARAGFIVGDPRIGCGVGNEVISSIHAGNAGPISSAFDPLLAVSFLEEEVVGIPVGHNRSADYSSGFPATSNGPMVSALALDHNLQFHYWDPTQLRASLGNTLPGAFSAESTMALGRFFPDTTGNTPNNLGPRADIPNDPETDGAGWLGAAIPCADRRLPQTFDETAFLPEECQDGSGPLDPPDEDAQAAMARAALTNERIREYVADWDFNTSHSVVRNAREFLRLYKTMDKRDQARWDDVLHPEVRAFVDQTAREAFVPESVWLRQRVRRSRGQVVISSDSREFSHERLQRALYRMVDRPDEVHSENIEEFSLDVEKSLEQLEQTDPEQYLNRVTYFQRLLSGAINVSESYAEFPRMDAAISQDLHLASTSIQQGLTLEVDIEFSAATAGELSINMPSRGFAAQIVPTAQRRLLIYKLPPRKFESHWVPERIVFEGRNARIYSVSVRRDGPVFNPVDKRWYDLRVIEEGLDWDYAREAASRCRFNGRSGSLAGPLDPKAYEFLQKEFRLDTYVWLGGKAEPGSGKQFQWTDGAAASANWGSDVAFPVPNDQQVYVVGNPQREGPTFRYLPQQTQFRNRSIGVLVDFGS